KPVNATWTHSSSQSMARDVTRSPQSESRLVRKVLSRSCWLSISRVSAYSRASATTCALATACRVRLSRPWVYANDASVAATATLMTISAIANWNRIDGNLICNDANLDRGDLQTAALGGAEV